MEKEKWYTMPYIQDKKVFKAVNFALKLKDQMAIGLAIHKASKYYQVPQREVAYFMGKIGGNKSSKNNIYRHYRQGKEQQ